MYGGITKEKMDRILDELKRVQGISISGNNPWTVLGKIKSLSVKISANWNESNSTVTLVVEDKTLFPPCFMIKSRIDEAVKKHL